MREVVPILPSISVTRWHRRNRLGLLMMTSGQGSAGSEGLQLTVRPEPGTDEPEICMG